MCNKSERFFGTPPQIVPLSKTLHLLVVFYPKKNRIKSSSLFVHRNMNFPKSVIIFYRELSIWTSRKIPP